MKSSKENMIFVGPDYAIQGDENCITLYKRRVTEKGGLQWDAKGYFNNYRQVLNRMIELEIHPLNNIEDILRVSDLLKEYICDSINDRSLGFCQRCGRIIETKK